MNIPSNAKEVNCHQYKAYIKAHKPERLIRQSETCTGLRYGLYIYLNLDRTFFAAYESDWRRGYAKYFIPKEAQQ